MTTSEELLQEISEKKERFNSVNNEIQGVINEIKNLNIEISEIQNDITNFTNANRLFESIEVTSISARSLNETPPEIPVVLNDEHIEIITKKKSNIRQLKHTTQEIAQEQQVLETQLFDTLMGVSNANNTVIQLKEDLRTHEQHSNYLQSKMAWLNDQLNERNNEVRIINQTKREAEQALAALKDRFISNTTLSGGRLDLEKTIISLQNQYNSLMETIDNLKNHMDEDTRLRQESKEAANRQTTEQNSSVNWMNERQQLREDLQKLNQEISEKKSKVQSLEKTVTKKVAAFEKFAPLIKKWSNKLNTVEIPSESVAQLNEKISQAKAQNDEARKQSHEKMTNLLMENAKLEKEVNRKRIALNRIVEQFHTDEFAMKKDNEEQKAQYELEEKKLLDQINEVKIKIAQKSIPQAKKAKQSSPKGEKAK